MRGCIFKIDIIYMLEYNICIEIMEGENIYVLFRNG